MNQNKKSSKWYLNKKNLVILFVLIVPAVFFLSKGSNHELDNEMLRNVLRHDISKSLFLNGKVQPLQSVAVFPAKPGTIQTIFVKEGDSVKKGDVLYSVKLEISGEQELLEKKARVKQLELQVDEKEKRFQAKSPIRDLIATESLIQEESELNRLKIELKASQQALEIAEREMGVVFKTDQKTRSNIINVLSSIEGIVTLVAKKSGEFVGAGQNLGTSSLDNRAIVVADLSSMLINAKVTEAEIRYIEKGLKVDISIDAYPELKLTGEIVRIGGQGIIDNTNNTFFEIEARINNVPAKILPEMTAYLEVKIASKANALVVPADSIVVLANKGFVRIPDKSKKEGFKTLSVKTGISNAEYVEVLEGLKEKDSVLKLDLAKIDINKLLQSDRNEKAVTR